MGIWPPMMTLAMDAREAAPGPVPSATGRRPATSITVVITSLTGQLLTLWYLWLVIGIAILAYVAAQWLPRVITVRQTGWRVTFALVVASLAALVIVPKDDNYQGMATLVILLLAVCLPYLFAKRLGEYLRASEYVWKLTCVLTSICVAVVIVYPKPEGYDGVGWPPKYGVDLQGGVNLIYQFDPQSQDSAPEAEGNSVKPLTNKEIQKNLELLQNLNVQLSKVFAIPFGGDTSIKFQEVYGYLFTEENRQILLTVVGFYFGNAAGKAST